MSSQSRIINAVNLCLKQKANIDFELNPQGVCAGLAGLYVKYTLENKTAQFFSLLNQLATLPPNYQLGTNSAIDNFIIQIEKAFRPSQYNGYEVQQGDLHKILDIRNKPLSNEFNLGLTTDESSWKEIFKVISRTHRSYFIASKNHAIAFTFDNGKYTVYDPNYSKNVKEFDSVDDFIKEIKDSFEYKSDDFGLAIRIFAHPNEAKESYPTYDEIAKIAFAHQIDSQSSTYATLASDINTLKYLFNQQKIDLSSLAKEYFQPEFNDLLLQQSKSDDVKNALLRGIKATLFIGAHKQTEKLIHHYLKTYTTLAEQQAFKKAIQKQLSEPLLILMTKKADYTELLKIFEQYNLPQNQEFQTNVNHLQLLTFIHQQKDSKTINLFLNTLSPAQIINQVQRAATSNQRAILELLFNYLDNTSISPTSFPSIFNREVIEKVDAITLSNLIDKNFSVNVDDPDLLLLCLQRKDKFIFDKYARAYANQTSHSEIWKNVDKHRYELIDLSASLGSTPLLNALIFLRKNDLIKKAWRNEISVEFIKGALTIALINDNQEMCLFLHQKLQAQQTQLDIDTLEFLYKKGLTESNLAILSILHQLNFNVLRNTEDIRALFMLCYEYDNYSIIEECFDKANIEIKKRILEYSLLWNNTALINLCVLKNPILFNEYLNESIQNPARLAKLNRVTNLLPPDTLSLQMEEQAQKTHIKLYCRKKLFRLAEILSKKIMWEKDELDNFLNELIESKNEQGIILLLKSYPQLRERTDLLAVLFQRNLLNCLNFLVAQGQFVETELIEPIFTAALMQNHKNLVTQLVKQKLITPTTKLKNNLTSLLQKAIDKGNDAIEPFIQSDSDFGLDFKKLFLFNCTHKKEEIANLLLTHESFFNEQERLSAIHLLFGEQSTSELFEKIYEKGYGRLYQFLLKTNIQNPRTTLLNSIKKPEQDPKFQQTALYLNPLKRAIKEKNESIFNSLFTQSELPLSANNELLLFLKDPLLFPRVLPRFVKKYGLENLLTEALKQQEWAVLAQLIETKPFRDLDTELQKSIQQQGNNIVKAHLENLELHYDKMDVRPQLFKLFTNNNALSHLAIPHHEAIQVTLERIELNMLDHQLDLNNQVYRYAFSHLSFKNALEELNKIFTECQQIIVEQHCDLEQPIDNPDIINKLAQLKLIMAGHDITPNYLKDEHEDLLAKLIENPRFKEICKLELQLYFLLKNFQKPITVQTQSKQDELEKALKALHDHLINKKLPISFVIPEIQSHLIKLPNNIEPPKPSQETKSVPQVTIPSLKREKERCIQSLNHYLKYRDQHLSFFSYFFDYYRGKIRAQHYKNLIKSAQSERELHLIEYAIFTNHNGTQLKKDMFTKLQFKDHNTAKRSLKASIQKSYSKVELAQLDKIIESLNKKINENDSTATATLFHDELTYLKRLNNPPSVTTKISFFQPKKQEIGFWQWVASWFGYNKAAAAEDKLAFKT